MIRIGCAGWSLPRAVQHRFPPGDSHLARYAQQFGAVEINSSFWRPHARGTYERWAAATPPAFRFSVKLPKAITHERRLVDCEAPLRAFHEQAGGLGERLGALLVQLPPSLALEPAVLQGFMRTLRRLHGGDVAIEPRHASWFSPEADALLRELRLARVLADPVRHDAGRQPGGWPDLVYLRLHGSPRAYYSSYEPALIAALAARLALAGREARAVWCIFDNTASGAAADNALALQDALEAP
jgi:uncharacterized protein YecE (DUF72 family)